MDRRLQTVFTVVLALLLGVTSFAGGLVAGHVLPALGRDQVAPLAVPSPLPATAATPSPRQSEATPDELRRLFTPLWESWNVIHEQYVDQPVDDLALVQGAIRGMLEALGDPNSSYMDPATYRHANDELSGQYEGIGAYVDTTTELLTIISAMPGSPAEAAGLLAGDQVIAVDGEDVTALDAELVRLQVIGPAGSHVHLTIHREGEVEPIEFDLTRGLIVVKSASGTVRPDGIAHVEVTTFGDKTLPELKEALEVVLAGRPSGLILDLRNNGGGYLSAAVEVTSQFLEDGVVLYEEYGDGSRKSFEVLPGGMATSIPMIVLINEGSASASEIVAGALQDAGRARLVGVTSYGKGTVQNWVPLSSDNGAVRITIARWLTPAGRLIQDVGLTPDLVVELTSEDRIAGRDPQLDEAVEALLGQLRAWEDGPSSR